MLLFKPRPEKIQEFFPPPEGNFDSANNYCKFKPDCFSIIFYSKSPESEILSLQTQLKINISENLSIIFKNSIIEQFLRYSNRIK